MTVSVGMTNTRDWGNQKKANPDNIHKRYVNIGTRINVNNHLEFYRPSGEGPGFAVDSINTEDLAAAKTMVITDAQWQFLNPDGENRTIILPAEAISTGYIYYIMNMADAAESITVKDDGGTTVMTVSQNEMGIALCNGTTWRAGVIPET